MRRQTEPGRCRRASGKEAGQYKKEEQAAHDGNEEEPHGMVVRPGMVPSCLRSRQTGLYEWMELSAPKKSHVIEDHMG
ncbi:hypothetical protein GSY71_01930 [Pusillimonas sp. TS35]|uniref:hypothetical protein n=1 Tax=Paracandidimonas lactea TaxID=2895524 RepID=UPI001369E32E|nr:hypothetical protein [Paracandidimonas lactea]MYN11913.1 hypothetical protein [Pusillimonas sp. TS35]